MKSKLFLLLTYCSIHSNNKEISMNDIKKAANDYLENSQFPKLPCHRYSELANFYSGMAEALKTPVNY